MDQEAATRQRVGEGDAATGKQHVPPRVPSTTGRSDVELRFNAHLLEALLGATGAALHTFWEMLHRGDAMGRTDGVFALADDFLVMSEWDGGLYHGDTARDMRKLHRMLSVCQNALILRIRADGAPSLDELILHEVTNPVDVNRIVVVHLDPGAESRNMGLALRKVATAIAPKLVEVGGEAQRVFADRLTTVGSRSDTNARHNSKHANDLVFQTYRHAMADFEANVDRLKTILGSDDAAKAVLDTDGVITRLGSVIAALERFRDEFHVPIHDLHKVVCSSVAARIEQQSFWDAINRIQTELGITGPKLAGFLTNSVATRIEQQSFWDAITRVQMELGITGPKLPGFLTDSVATRIEQQSFWDAITRVQMELGVTGPKLPGFLTDSVATRLVSDTFMTLLKWLVHDISISIEKLASFGNSFFSTDESVVRETFAILIDEYGIRPIDLPARNPFWSHVKKAGKLDELRVHLATCTTTGAVTKHIKKLNGCGIGQGAVRCKFARPKLVNECVEVPKATKQSTLCAFFAKGSVGPSE